MISLPSPSPSEGDAEGTAAIPSSLGGMWGALIDTPGIKGFGTFDMEPEEITGYFREIFQFSKDCRFSNCTHTHEPGCAVLRAVEDHYIAESRYQSYLSMLDDKDENKYREAY
jgi:ribosome biogenesis GTPase